MINEDAWVLCKGVDTYRPEGQFIAQIIGAHMSKPDENKPFRLCFQIMYPAGETDTIPASEITTIDKAYKPSVSYLLGTYEQLQQYIKHLRDKEEAVKQKAAEDIRQAEQAKNVSLHKFFGSYQDSDGTQVPQDAKID
jgi:hypothetical protein